MIILEVLLTGGLGYIGVNLSRFLSAINIDSIIIDTHYSTPRAQLSQAKAVYEVDILDRAGCEKIFRNHEISAVINLAGLKSVQESFENPEDYFRVNAIGVETLFELSIKYSVKKFIWHHT